LVRDFARRGKGRYIFDYIETPTHILAPREMTVDLEVGEVFNAVAPKSKLLHLQHNIKPRHGQIAPFTVLRQRKSGLVNGAPGIGKTVLGLFAAVGAQEPFVIVCPNLGILGQWEDEIKKKTNVTKIAQMHSKARKQGYVDWDEAECLLTTPDTLSNVRWSMPRPFYSRWGTIIYDECHHSPSERRRHSLYLFDGVRLGLSATLDRRDGLDMLVYRHIGPIIYQNLTLPLDPDINFVAARAKLDDEDYEYDIDTHLYRALANSTAWGKALMNQINRRLSEGRRVLVISHIRDHMERFSQIYGGSGLITQFTPFKERHTLLKTKQLTFGTFNSAREALDGPELDTVIFATPFHVWGAFFQGLGRVSRDVVGKEKPIVDIMEAIDIHVVRSMLMKLRANIKAEGYEYSRTAASPTSRLRRVR
jgi:superfamily II DNA or RNA helicase